MTEPASPERDPAVADPAASDTAASGTAAPDTAAPDTALADTARRDRSFAPVVLAGLAVAALFAVAAAHDWSTGHSVAAGIRVSASAKGTEAAPPAEALALVALAAWGVVLVTRRVVRRFVCFLGLLASVGGLVAVMLGARDATDGVTAGLVAKGASEAAFFSSLTTWFYVSGIAAAFAALTFAVAVWKSPSWPAMGSRYDAPGACAEQPLTDQDMWRALDEGHDPTS
jgi:hypothetical protein